MSESPNATQRLIECLTVARRDGATRLQVLAGQPPRMRLGEELSGPIQDEAFHFRDTQQIVEELLEANEAAELDRDGSVEVAAPPEWGITGTVTVFFGNGCHNLVVHLA